MNRFSSKPTLSKFMTGVRETVDFVIKNSAQLAIVTSLLVSGSVAPAAPVTTVTAAAKSEFETMNEYVAKICKDATTPAEKTECEQLKQGLKRRVDPTLGRTDESKERECLKLEEKLSTAAKAAKESCSKAGIGSLERCYDQVKSCQQEELNLDELNEDDEGGKAPLCDRVLANKCSGLSTFMDGRNYREEKRDAEKERKEAKKLVDDLTADQNDLKKDLVTQQRKLQEEQMKAAHEARNKERQIANKMKELLAGISEDQKKAFEDLQKVYTAMDEKYLQMRTEIRAKADAVAAAEDELQTTCRGAAERRYAEAEKVRVAELKARSKNVGSSVSGSTARRKAATARARNIDYTAYLTECTSGTSAEGVSARNKIKAAQRAKETTEKTLNEAAALLEAQRTQYIKKIQDMEGDATNKQTQVVERINEELTAMGEEQQLTAQINQQRITEFQQNQSSQMASIQQKLMSANQELMETQKEISLATTRESCAGANAQRTESKRERVEEGFTNAVTDIDELANVCRVKTNRCAEPAETSTPGATKVRDICAIAKDIISGTSPTTGRKRTKVNVRGVAQ